MKNRDYNYKYFWTIEFSFIYTNYIYYVYNIFILFLNLLDIRTIVVLFPHW